MEIPKKISIFHEKCMYFRKFRAKIALKLGALRDVIMLLLMTSMAKKREKCNVTCVLLENL